jgi:hypothetical protein
MRFTKRLLAAAGLRAHPTYQDPKQPTDDHDQTPGARRPTRRWWARTAVGVTAVAMLVLATAAPALAAGDPTAAAAANTGHVYWGTVDFSGLAGTIGRANLAGAMANQSFIPGATQPFASPSVAVDAAHVYWTNNFTGTIGRANLDGTGRDFPLPPAGRTSSAGLNGIQPTGPPGRALRTGSDARRRRGSRSSAGRPQRAALWRRPCSGPRRWGSPRPWRGLARERRPWRCRSGAGRHRRRPARAR